MPDDARGRFQPDHLRSVSDAVCHLDRRGRFVYVNPAAEALLGRRATELIGQNSLKCFPATRGSVLQERLTAALADGRPRTFEYLYEPHERWYEVRVFPSPVGLAVFLRDVDEQHRAEQERLAELRRMTAVLEALPSPTVLVDGDGRIISVNRAWAASEDLLRDDGPPGGVGEDYLTVMTRGLEPEDHAVLAKLLPRLLAGQGDGGERTFQHDYARRTRSGQAWFHLQAARVDDAGRVVVTHTDITERVRTQQELAWQAEHDDLTGLPNRARLLELIGEAAAEKGRCAALLLFDLDGFKTVNDSLGHEVGDALLCEVGRRLSEHLRADDAVGRLGGDQFLVVAHDCDDSEAAALAFRLQSAFARPFEAAGIPVPVTASIGVALTTTTGQADPHSLLSDVDTAMYAAKSAGRDRVHLFTPGLRDAARWRLEVASRLRDEALEQLVVHYQPVVRLDTGEVEGMEALLRWQHPERGLLPPDAFLAVAEETGQLIPITRWVLSETTRRAAAWAAEGLPLRMSVNISARHFSTETLVHDVREALRESGLPPEQLTLELTESSVAEDPTRAEDQLAVLRGLGVRIAIDDFGTGWSSLAQLLAMPIGTLKLDRSLLTAAERLAAGGTHAVLDRIVALTRTLGIRSVAEGVETAEHLRMVRAAGCDLAQGYLLARPMPPEEVPRWVARVRAAGGDSCALALRSRAG
ncbi:MAG TPA: EAL domain-containing protein [Geodermatophilus sp.]|nr:EAL domain-containing protein [Geodermatophilus sp.]